MTIREYFKNSKNNVEKFLIQREGKATVVVPGTERFNLNKDILDCEIKSVTIHKETSKVISLTK